MNGMKKLSLYLYYLLLYTYRYWCTYTS